MCGETYITALISATIFDYPSVNCVVWNWLSTDWHGFYADWFRERQRFPRDTNKIPLRIPKLDLSLGLSVTLWRERWKPARHSGFFQEESGAGDGNRTHVSSLGTPAACFEKIKPHWVINLLGALFASEGVLWGHYTIDSSFYTRILLKELTDQQSRRWLSFSTATVCNQRHDFCERSLKLAHVNSALFRWAHSMQRW